MSVRALKLDYEISTCTIYYEINVLVDKVMGLRKHGYNVTIPSDQKHLCLEEWKPMKRTCELSLTDDSVSRYTQYQLLYLGLS